MEGFDIGKGLVALGVVLIISALIIGTVLPTLENITHTNETIGNLNASAAGPNKATLPCTPVVLGTYTIYNSTGPIGSGDGTGQNILTEITDYTLNKKTGQLTNVTTVNYVRATWDCGQLTTAASRSSISGIGTNTLTGLTLAGVATVVIGAAFIMRNLAF